MHGSNKFVDTTQNRCFRTRALLEPGVKELVLQFEVRLNPHVGSYMVTKGPSKAIKLQQIAEKSV
jgi:hypothetical protein